MKVASGRLPRGCDADGREVLQVAGEKVRPALELYDVPLRVVGTGRLDALPLGTLPPPAGSIDASASFLVTACVAPLLSIQALDIVPRTFTWTRLLDPGAVHPWNTNRTLNGLRMQEPERVDANGEELVRLEHVRRRFGTRAETVDAVANVTLALKAGAFPALVGPSGFA